MHRDLKAGNLILTANLCTLKLADFGMSKAVRKREMAKSVHTGFTGTVRYMAPEVLTQATGHYTEKADIYSAALLMYYIACGERPKILDRRSVAGLQKRPDTSKVRWPELAEIMTKCWCPEPDLRLSTGAIIAALDALPDAAALKAGQIQPKIGCCTVM